MKNILKLAVFAVFMTFPQLSYAVENAQVVLDLKPETEEKAPAVGLLLDEYLAEVADFDAKYPGEQVEEDFKDDIRELHPEYGDSGINTKETLTSRCPHQADLQLSAGKGQIVHCHFRYSVDFAGKRI